jgi:hypothetical protein
MAHKPDGIFLSNGPGDPAATGEYAVPVIRQLLDTGKPLFGICLGHQLLGLAVGAKTVKMHQGHRGANHPVKRLQRRPRRDHQHEPRLRGRPRHAPGKRRESHVSLFDGSNCGIELTDRPASACNTIRRRARARRTARICSEVRRSTEYRKGLSGGGCQEFKTAAQGQQQWQQDDIEGEIIPLEMRGEKFLQVYSLGSKNRQEQGQRSQNLR